ncbi:MAG: hypothetical protein CMJ94_09820 [Planctomycetes bacterium]|nr:hypothetical protein [Planctomycetota bacterium]
MLVSLIRPLALLAPFAALAWWSSAPGPAAAADASSLGVRLAARTLQPDQPEALLQAAQEAAERELVAETTREAQQAARARDALCAALADGPQADALPWDLWIDAELRNRDSLALGLYLASVRAGAPDSLERAKRLGQRDSPVPLRIAAHRTMWAIEPQLALQQGRDLIRELPRGTTGMHARYAALLDEVGSELALELLIALAHRDGLESHARVVAIQALARTGRVELGADLATIWTASTGDIATRQQALLATLALDPRLGERVLLTRLPDADAQPVLHGFAMDLIAERGLRAPEEL